MKKTLLPILALLALPTSAFASSTVGGNPAAGTPDHLIQCTDDDTGLQQPCTITLDKVHGAAIHVPAGKVITSYSGYFDTDSQVGLRLMKRNANGTLTSDGYTGYTYVDGGVQTVDTNLKVPAGDHTIAIDLHSGSIGGLEDTSSTIFAADHILDDGETGAGEAVGYDVQFAVTYGDAPAPSPTSTPAPASSGGGSGSSSGSGSDGGSGGGADEPKSGFTIEPKAILTADSKSIRVHLRNDLSKAANGKLVLKAGGTTIGTSPISDFEYHSGYDFTVDVTRKAAKKLLKKRTLSLTATATANGGTYTQAVKAYSGGAKGYDGTYRGTGGLVIVVKRGVITAVSQTLNTYCSTNGRFISRTMSVGQGFPALIGNDGSFDHKAPGGSDSFTYRGKLSRSGESKGYNSLWYTTFDNDPSSGYIRAVSCFQASNWTATRK